MHTFKKLSLVLSLTVPGAAFAAAGDLDVTFGSAGKVSSVIPTSKIGIQPADGKLLVVDSESSNFRLARYLPGGTLDVVFGTNGVVTSDIRSVMYNIADTGQLGGNDFSADGAYDVAMQADGKILVAGYTFHTNPPTGLANSDNIVVVRYLTNGLVDTTFGTNGVAMAEVLKAGNATHDRGYALAVQTNGAIVVAGEMYEGTKAGDFVTVRFTSTGVLDTTFASTGYKLTSLSSYLDTARDVVIQGDGKIVVAGEKSNISPSSFGVVRYNANGTADTTFGPGGIRSVVFSTATNSNSSAYNVAVQSDGKMVVGGYSYTTTTQGDYALARFNANGTLDTTFDGDGKVTTNFGGSETGADVMIQGNGKIVMVGTAGLLGMGLTRYNTNGSLDTTFGSGGKVTNASISGGVDGLIQSDGKIVAAGGGFLARFLAQ